MTDVKPRPPEPIRWAGTIAIVQSVIVLAFAVLLVIRDLTGAEEVDLVSDSGAIAWVGTGTAVFLLIIFGAVITGAVLMMRGHQWGRGPIVLLEIILIGVSWFMFTGGVGWAGVLTAGSAIAALLFLFNPRSVQWAEARHGF